MLPLSTLSSPPEHFNFATDVVDTWARKDLNLLAMQWTDDRGSLRLQLSYEYFSKQSHKAAQLLTDLGAKPGDRVMIVLNRVPAW
jgi:acyl-coenzyme A synthetase/AMP-(fatty) acid ligase